ncbi:19461_t:CDS:1, partial [Funneliformis geosporum]
VEIVRELGTLSRHHKNSIGVLITSSNENYTMQARRAARISALTDKEIICSDLVDVEHRQKEIQIRNF